ncbi:PhoU family transcriptional regulator [Natrarchaeobius sp. A-rgal3]|uniref:PhoU family transcriptional regulator n=1 Tax=Natrarchaeobius versutus TaxID=1679078 RepID=UPI00350FEE79
MGFHDGDWDANTRFGAIRDVVEAVDRCAPETKRRLAEETDLSEHYISEIVQELKRNGLIRKGYVVDRAAMYEHAVTVTTFGPDDDRSAALLELFEQLDDVTRRQYDAASATFAEGTPDPAATTLEPLVNERYEVVLKELKTLTIRSDWPGNRVVADLARIAQNMEIVGDRACFIENAIETTETLPRGIICDRIETVFEDGQRINDHFGTIFFEANLECVDALYDLEREVHRTLDELFELVTAYDPAVYGSVVGIIRTLERCLHYWVSAAEIAVRLHTGLDQRFPLTVS